MATHIYSWNREWTSEARAARGEAYGLFGIGHRVVPVEDFTLVNGLVLLGEAGLGKTHELGKLAEPYIERGQASKVYPLRRLDGPRLRRGVKGTKAYKKWKKGEQSFYLFLDALDESLDRSLLYDVATLAEGGGDGSTFHVWVTCRGPYWERVPELREEFSAIWAGSPGETAVWVDYPGQTVHSEHSDHLKVCELHLSELSDDALRTAARAEGVDDPDQFVREVIERGAGSVARTPDTLAEAIAMYNESGEVPRSRQAIYGRIVPRLADELRREATHTRGQRLAVARRVAGMLTFCERAAVSLHDDRDGMLSRSAVQGFREPIEGGGPDDQVEVSPEVLDETLATALFGPHSLGAVEFVRSPVREYLAADWLRVRETPKGQVLALLTAGGQVRPRMAETAAWVASARPEIFRALVDEDPEVLLRSDLYAVGDDDKRRLVKSLLSAHADWRASWELIPAGIAYTGIEDELREWIADPTVESYARVAAIRVATAAHAEGLGGACVDVALDESAPTDLRAAALAAAPALLGRGDEDLDRLRPIAKGEAGADPHHDLMGLAVRALVPERLNAWRAFQAMPIPSEYRPNDPFLESLIEVVIPNLQERGVRRVLQRADEIGDPESNVLADLVKSAAWLRLADLGATSDVAKNLVRAAYRQGHSSGERGKLVLTRWRSEKTLRREVVRTLVRDRDREGLRLLEYAAMSTRDLILEEDYDWLVEQYDLALGEEREVWAGVVHCQLRSAEAFRDVFGGDPPPGDPVRRIYAKRVQIDSGEWIEEDVFEPQDPGGAIAALEAQRAVVREQEIQEAEAELAKRNAEADRRLSVALDPTSGSWIAVAEALRAALDGVSAQRTSLWAEMSDDQKARARALALRHLAALAERRGPLQFAERLYAKAALYTVYDWKGVAGVPVDAWETLAEVLVYEGPSGNDEGAPELHAELLQRAFEVAPQAVLVAFRRGLDYLVQGHGIDQGPGGNVYAYAEPVFGTETDRVIKEVLASGPVPPSAFGQALRVLLEREDPDALDLARVALGSVPHRTDDERNRALAAAMALISKGRGQAWPVLKVAFDADVDLFKQVVRTLEYEIHSGDALEGIDAEGLAEMYRKVEALYPYERVDRASGLSFRPTFRDHVEHIKNRLLSELRLKGPQAAKAYGALVSDLPKLRYAYRNARREWAQSETPMPSPRELLQLVGDRKRRWVRTEAELFEVVMEQLHAFGRWLQAENQPGVYTLWNAVPRSTAIGLVKGVARLNRTAPKPLVAELDRLRKSKSEVVGQAAPTVLYAPKDEAELSDALARFLRSRLDAVVVGRETEVKRGHRPDLVISSFAIDAARNRIDEVEVAVEVKPSWSDVVITALRSQLSEGYLEPEGRRYGAYLAAMYGSERWFDANPRRKGARGSADAKKRNANSRSIQELRDELEAEANAINRDGRGTVGVVVVDATLPPASATGGS